MNQEIVWFVIIMILFNWQWDKFSFDIILDNSSKIRLQSLNLMQFSEYSMTQSKKPSSCDFYDQKRHCVLLDSLRMIV